jgi:hypothetical protein
VAGLFFMKSGVAGRLSEGGHDDIHQLHSDQYLDVRIEPAPVKDNDLASVDGHYTETHNYWSACARTGLAASRRSSLVVQEIYRRGGGLASSIARQGNISEKLRFEGTAVVLLLKASRRHGWNNHSERL